MQCSLYHELKNQKSRKEEAASMLTSEIGSVRSRTGRHSQSAAPRTCRDDNGARGVGADERTKDAAVGYAGPGSNTDRILLRDTFITMLAHVTRGITEAKWKEHRSWV
jgi:hypothetical protein